MHTVMYLLIPKLTFIVIVKQSVVCLHVLIGYEMVVFVIECFCYDGTSTLESSVNNSINCLRFGSSSCSIWTSFESSWPADLDYLSFGSIP